MSAPVDVLAVPEVPAPDPCDYRVQSAPVLIKTASGEFYTARWTVYQDSDFAPVWELIGRDGLQRERGDVIAWFYCGEIAELCEAARYIAFAMRDGAVFARDYAAQRLATARANVGGAA